MSAEVTHRVTRPPPRAGSVDQPPAPPTRTRGQRASISARKRADGTTAFRVTYRLNGTQHVVTLDTTAEAARVVRDMAAYGAETALGLLDARDQTADITPTVAEWTRAFIDTVPAITDGTRRGYRDLVRLDIDGTGLGAVPISKLTRAMVTAWADRLRTERNLATQTIRARTGLLFSAMAAAVESGWLADNPVRGVKIPRQEARTEMVFVEPAEFRVLLDNMRPHYWPLLAVLYGTGLRWGEATALRVRDLDLDAEQPMLRVSVAWKHGHAGTRDTLGPPKTIRSQRHISLPPEIVALLRPLIVGKTADDLVLTNRHGRRIQQGSFWAVEWKPAAAALESATGKRPRVHDLRHSHASNMIAAGANLVVIQYRLGHTSITTTIDRYGHLANNAQGLAAQAASASLSAAFPLTVEPPRAIGAA